MTPDQTPLTFEDLIEVLVSVEARVRTMRSLGTQSVTVPALVSLLLIALRDKHALQINVDKVMAAGKAAAQRAAREMPAPPSHPFTAKGPSK